MQIDLTKQAAKLIRELLATGLYGETEADVCERIFYEKLRELSADQNDRGMDEVQR